MSRRHPLTGWILALAALLATLVAAFAIGKFPVTPGELLRGVVARLGGPPSGLPVAVETVIWQIRLPRIAAGLLVGAALSAAGAAYQGMFRNPLASPDILGVNHAAGLASVGALMLLPSLSVMWLPPLAFAGGIAAFVLLRLVSGRSAPLRLALTGVALTAFYASLTDYLMLSRPMEINSALLWLTGSLWGRGWNFVEIVAPWLLLLLPLSLWFCRDLDVLALGDDSAATLGIRVSRVQRWVLLLAVALAAISVAACGPVGFIGLASISIAGPINTRTMVRRVRRVGSQGRVVVVLGPLRAIPPPAACRTGRVGIPACGRRGR